MRNLNWFVVLVLSLVLALPVSAKMPENCKGKKGKARFKCVLTELAKAQKANTKAGDIIKAKDKDLAAKDTEIERLKTELDLANGNVVDVDGDEIPNSEDNCPNDFNKEQEDTDGDHIGDACDPHPNMAERDVDSKLTEVGDLQAKVKQLEEDGKAKDKEISALQKDLVKISSASNDHENMVSTLKEQLAYAEDPDGDGIRNKDEETGKKDNCPYVANKDQADQDKDGVGDACDRYPNVPQDSLVSVEDARVQKAEVQKERSDLDKKAKAFQLREQEVTKREDNQDEYDRRRAGMVEAALERLEAVEQENKRLRADAEGVVAQEIRQQAESKMNAAIVAERDRCQRKTKEIEEARDVFYRKMKTLENGENSVASSDSPVSVAPPPLVVPPADSSEATPLSPDAAAGPPSTPSADPCAEWGSELMRQWCRKRQKQ